MTIPAQINAIYSMVVLVITLYNVYDERIRHNYALLHSKWNNRKSCAHEVWSQFTSVWHSPLLIRHRFFSYYFHLRRHECVSVYFPLTATLKLRISLFTRVCVCLCVCARPRRIFHMPCLPLYCTYSEIQWGRQSTQDGNEKKLQEIRLFWIFALLL